MATYDLTINHRSVQLGEEEQNELSVEDHDPVFGWRYTNIDSCPVCYDLGLVGVNGSMILHDTKTPTAICIGYEGYSDSGCSRTAVVTTARSMEYFPGSPIGMTLPDQKLNVWQQYQKDYADSLYGGFQVIANALERLIGEKITLPDPVYSPDIEAVLHPQSERAEKRENHEAPGETCSCGYYLLDSPFRARRSERSSWNVALFCRAEGKTTIHRSGYRTASYTVLGAVLPNQKQYEVFSRIGINIPAYSYNATTLTKQQFISKTGCAENIDLDGIFGTDVEITPRP